MARPVPRTEGPASVHFFRCGPGRYAVGPAHCPEARAVFTIAKLTAQDAPAYRALMLEAYAQPGDAFTSTAEERAALRRVESLSTELEDIMSGFYDRKFDVLLSTTIVESGLDIATANTLVIHRADGTTKATSVLLRIDTPIEVDYYLHGGILKYVLRQLVARA